MSIELYEKKMRQVLKQVLARTVSNQPNTIVFDGKAFDDPEKLLKNLTYTLQTA